MDIEPVEEAMDDTTGIGGEISGLKHVHGILIASIIGIGGLLGGAFFYQGSRIDALSSRVDDVVKTQGEMRSDIAVVREKVSYIERDIAEIKQFLIPTSRSGKEPPKKAE